MNLAVISSLIILDIIVIGVLSLFAFSGYRRGGVKAVISLFLLYVVVLISMILYERPAIFLQVMFDVSSPLTRIICFSIIFIVLYTISRVVYFILSKLVASIAVRGVFSGILGSIFGILEAVILIGIIFMNINFYPVKPPLNDSLSFNLLKDVPKDIKEKSLWFLPEGDLSKYEESLKSKKEGSKQEI